MTEVTPKLELPLVPDRPAPQFILVAPPGPMGRANALTAAITIMETLRMLDRPHIRLSMEGAPPERPDTEGTLVVTMPQTPEVLDRLMEMHGGPGSMRNVLILLDFLPESAPKNSLLDHALERIYRDSPGWPAYIINEGRPQKMRNTVAAVVLRVMYEGDPIAQAEVLRNMPEPEEVP